MRLQSGSTPLALAWVSSHTAARLHKSLWHTCSSKLGCVRIGLSRSDGAACTDSLRSSGTCMLSMCFHTGDRCIASATPREVDRLHQGTCRGTLSRKGPVNGRHWRTKEAGGHLGPCRRGFQGPYNSSCSTSAAPATPETLIVTVPSASAQSLESRAWAAGTSFRGFGLKMHKFWV